MVQALVVRAAWAGAQAEAELRTKKHRRGQARAGLTSRSRGEGCQPAVGAPAGGRGQTAGGWGSQVWGGRGALSGVAHKGGGHACNGARERCRVQRKVVQLGGSPAHGG